MNIDIRHADYREFLPTIPDCSIDFVCIDPPYTDGKKDVLSGHKIQTSIDILPLTKEYFRILKPNSFYAFFGQMPTILAWYNAAIESGFTYKEHITWVKRKISSPYQKVLRQKEEIFILQKGNANFNKTNGEYEDIKMPLYLDGLLHIETIKRQIAELKYEIKHGKKRIVDREKGSKKNDAIYNNAVTQEVTDIDSINFTNVWSFSSHNTSSYNKSETNVKHPTVKSIDCVERLVELCSFENAIVVDTFLGSGTTAIACKNTNRNFNGCEIFEDYYNISVDRVNKTQEKLF